MISFGNFRFWQLVVVLGALVDIHRVAAQIEWSDTPTEEVQSQVDLSKPLTWQEACKLIGTQDNALAERIEKSLREALRSPERTEVMACALMLSCVERGDTDGVKSALAGTRSVFPTASVETQSFMARVRLWLWLSANTPKEVEYAASTFRDLVTSTHRGELPKVELRAHAQLLGTVCGMLQPESAESPIPADTLKIAEQCLSASNIPDVKSRFKQSQQNAKQRAAALEQTIGNIKSKIPDDVTNEQATRKSRLAELGYEFTNTRDLMIEIVRNSREVSRQNKFDRRKLADYIRRLKREWTTPTAGHPGQPPIEPGVPQKSYIKVVEYTEIDDYETRTDVDGNKYEVKVGTKRKDRSQSDIDRERNEKYSRLMAEYQLLKADFDRRIAIYVPLLNSWIESDRVRRLKLQEENTAAEARSEELLTSNKQLRKEAVEAKSEFREQRSDVEVLAGEYELTDIALQSLASKSFCSAFRPPHFKLIDVDEEKNRLMSRIKK